MVEAAPVDLYEVLQISSNAEPETVHRVFRLLAQRFHPDNQETGSENRFREVNSAYQVLSDPEQRAKYDVGYQKQRQERWRFAAKGAETENDFAAEHLVRLTTLEILYMRRRVEPQEPGVFLPDLEKLIGRAREQLEFTIWYLVQRKLVQRSDNSVLVITADGVEYLEQNHQGGLSNRRLRAQND
jgi:curved DNA-binding protein CbpA